MLSFSCARLTGFALWVVTLIVPGISFVGGDTTLQEVGIIFVVALIFGLVNAIIKPIVQIMSIPLYILTLGLIHIVINALMLWITSWITEHTTHWGLLIDDFWWTAIWAAIVLSIVSWLLSLVVRDADTHHSDLTAHWTHARIARGRSARRPPASPRRRADHRTHRRVGVLGAQDVRPGDLGVARPDGHGRQPVGQVPRAAGRRPASDHPPVAGGLAALVGQARGGAAETRQGTDRAAGASWNPGGPGPMSPTGAAPGFDLTEAGTQKRLAVWLVDDPAKVPGIAALGPDALSLGPDDLAGVLAGQSGRLKTVITDQKVIAGIGNAYSDEILHVAKLSPFATAGKLTDAQLAALHDAMISVLTDAVIAVRRPAGRDAEGGEALRAAGARPHRTAVPGVRRHRARGVVRRQVVPVLPDVPDGRQDPGRPADVATAQVVWQYDCVADVSAC